MKNLSITYLVLMLASLLGFSASLSAHHSNAAYDLTSEIEITGVVSRLQWRNPHVIIELDVTDEDGEVHSWPLEGAGIMGLTQDGWNKETLSAGAQLTAVVSPTKRGTPGGILRSLAPPTEEQLAAGGSAFAFEDASLQEMAARTDADYREQREAIREWEAMNRPDSFPRQSRDGGVGAFDAANRAAHAGVALFDFTGIWIHRGLRERAEVLGGAVWEFLPVPELTEKSKAIQADVLARRAAGDPTADPATLCYPHGLQRSMTRNGNMMLYQIETAVFMNHRMYNDYRAIYWDGRDHVPSEVRTDSYNGDSIAYWGDDHLFVETIGFGQDEHYINPGIPIGAQGRVEERWRLINDGNTLEIEFRMTDPEHWIGEWIDYKYWDRIEGVDIVEGHCIYAQDGVLAGPQ